MKTNLTKKIILSIGLVAILSGCQEDTRPTTAEEECNTLINGTVEGKDLYTQCINNLNEEYETMSASQLIEVINKKDTAIADKQNDIIQKSAIIYEKEITIADLNDKLDLAINNIEEFQKNLLDEKDITINELEKDKVDLENLINKNNLDIQKLNSDISILTTERDNLIVQKNNLTNDLSTANSTINNLTVDKNNLQTTINTLNNDIMTLNSSVSSLTLDKTNLTNSLNTANTTISTLSNDFETANSTILSLNSQIVALNNDISILTTERDNLLIDKTNLTNSLNTANTNIATLTTERDNLVNSLNTANATITSLNTDISILSNDNNTLTTDLTTANNTLTTLTNTNNTLQTTLDNIEECVKQPVSKTQFYSNVLVAPETTAEEIQQMHDKGIVVYCSMFLGTTPESQKNIYDASFVGSLVVNTNKCDLENHYNLDILGDTGFVNVQQLFISQIESFNTKKCDKVVLRNLETFNSNADFNYTKNDMLYMISYLQNYIDTMTKWTSTFGLARLDLENIDTDIINALPFNLVVYNHYLKLHIKK